MSISLCAQPSTETSSGRRIISLLQQFFQIHRKSDRPVLLAVSGGPDSLALFYACRALAIPIHVAHVDHGWRPESHREALALKDRVEKEDVPFHLGVAVPPTEGDNWEERAREQRITFFRQLHRHHHYQAVMLAHHREDLAETAFKRLVDGAHLDKLGGLRPVHELRELTLWRPFLSLDKKILVAWLEDQGIGAISDMTNGADYCTRGLFREVLFPQLSDQIGRSAVGALEQLAHHSWELEAFLQSESDPWMQQVKRGALGNWLDLTEARGEHPYLIQYIIRRFCALSGIVLSRESVALAAKLIKDHKVGHVSRGHQTVYLDRGRLMTAHLPPGEFASIPVSLGKTEVGGFTITVTEDDSENRPAGWQELYSATSWKRIPKGNYEIAMPIPSTPFPTGPTLSRHYNKHRVPTFLRRLVPVVWDKKCVITEFLTTRGGSKNMAQTDMISVGVSLSSEGLGLGHKPYKFTGL